MLKWLTHFFQKKPGPVEPGEPASLPHAKPDGEVEPFYLGLTDARFEGWFNYDTGTIISDLEINADDTVLDVGCGIGGPANFCGQRGAHVILVDIDIANASRSKMRVEKTPARRVDAFVSDSSPLPLADETATKIMCSEVLEHVDDPNAVLRELSRVGKPGARYLISVPDPSAEHLQQGIAPDWYFQKPNHIRIIERDEFEQMVRDAGLIVEERIGISFFWNIWWLFLWICDQEMRDGMPHPPYHQLLQNWAKTWDTLLAMDEGIKVKAALDKALPKSQILIARKP